mgnify:CR=1 FL=1
MQQLAAEEQHRNLLKRFAMPVVTETERPRGIRINANTYVPQSPVQRHKMNSPHN